MQAGRVMVMHVGGLFPGGFLACALYLHNSIGLAPANWDLLCRLGAQLKMANVPCIVMGDFNVEPDVLQHSGWVDAIDGVAIHTAAGTCTPANRVIDFFVSQALSSVVEVSQVNDVAIAPHTPVQLSVRSLSKIPQVRMAKVPRRFPRALPIGCRQEPSSTRWGQAARAMERSSLSASWKVFVSAAELEWLEVFQISPDLSRAYVGRAGDIRV
eukprot:1066546-Pyramimonas_sp.AAC.1